ncbi:MAG: ABC transporter permease [Myxococcota bacterium]
MRHVTTVAGRELRGLFVSPVAYGVLSLFSVLGGVFFLLYVAEFSEWIFRLQQMQAVQQLQEINLSDHLVNGFFGSMSMVLLFLIPGVTMSLFTAEKTNGTQELLFTSPLTIWDIVIGKFVAAAAFVTLLVAVIGLFPAILFLYGDPEIGKTVAGLLGILLVGWTYAAIGCFASSLTRSQVLAFLITFVILLCILLVPAIADLGVAGGAPGVADALRWVSTGSHFENLVKGLVDTADLAYFGVMIGSFLFVTKAVVESVRWR